MFGCRINLSGENEINSDISDSDKVIVALDIGTTSARSFVFDQNYEVIGTARFMISTRCSKDGQAEIDAELFFKSIVKIIKESIIDAKKKPEDVLCLGICTQRGTFTTWDKVTGKVYHNLITWKDSRSEKLADNMNNGLSLKMLRFVTSILYFLTRKKQFMQGKNYSATTYLVVTRLLWAQKNYQKLKSSLDCPNTVYGMLDTWLLYKFKMGLIDFNENLLENYDHISDISNSSATGFFNPFEQKYAWWAFLIFSINKKMLPRVVNNDHDFGYTHPSIFGVPLKIAALTTDQAASVWGNCCFKKGDIKITIGTGAILSVNTGAVCDSIGKLYYPMIAWKFSKADSKCPGTVHVLETDYPDSGLIVGLSQKIGLFNDPMETSDMAYSVPDTNGVSFFPTNYKLGHDLCGFVGINEETSKGHIVRAILEGMAFTISDMFLTYARITNSKVQKIRIDGGIAANDFLCQAISNICNVKIERATSVEMTVQGLAYLCAFNCGKFESFEEISKLYKIGKIFHPQDERIDLLERMACWKKYYKKV